MDTLELKSFHFRLNFSPMLYTILYTTQKELVMHIKEDTLLIPKRNLFNREEKDLGMLMAFLVP